MALTYETILANIREAQEIRELAKGLTYEQFEILAEEIRKEKREEKKIVREPIDLRETQFYEDKDWDEFADYWLDKKIEKYEMHTRKPENWMRKNYPQFKTWSYRTLKDIVNANYNNEKVRYWVMEKLIME